eukprot:CAMPEP_0119318722 /NCGR_PEP_ID=MMETSP1333-20130426/47423_1 /TAXON_ID=418940 /ORGANISM="Scyphosphaera apsteinii, Strain RCC1455" /LENGTH=41 /DNA_ID= /DNA_START= /DNA_END= /DNA_ORIENTATION=
MDETQHLWPNSEEVIDRLVTMQARIDEQGMVIAQMKADAAW